MPSPDKADNAQRGHRKRCDLIARDRGEELWFGPQEFVYKAEQAVSDQSHRRRTRHTFAQRQHLFGEHKRGKGNHGRHVHHAKREQDEEQRPTASETEQAVAQAH